MAADAGGRRTSTLRGMGSIIGQALRLVWSTSRRSFVAAIVIAVFAGLLPPLTVWLGKVLIDAVVAGRSVGPAALALALTTAASRLLQGVEQHNQRICGDRVETEATHRFLDHVSTVDLGHFEDTRWQNRMQRASEGINYRPLNVTFALIGLIGVVVTLIGMLGVVSALHPLLLVLAVVSSVPMLGVQRSANRLLYRHAFAWTDDQRLRQYLHWQLTAPETAMETRAFGVGPHLLSWHRQMREAEIREKHAIHVGVLRATLLASLISGVTLATAYFFVAQAGVRGSLTIGTLSAVIASIASIVMQLELLLSTFTLLDENAPFLRDYFDFLQPEVLVPLTTSPRSTREGQPTGYALDDVSFTYPGSSTPALTGITLSVRPGELLAIVGANGSGKTTLVKLLLRFYDPSEGSVHLDGVDLRETDPAELRDRVGVLLQQYGHYQLSIRDCVTLGRVDRPVDDAEVLGALRAARAESILDDLPQGLDSPVGRLLEGGHELSGGQWQRLALARLFYRSADIWILDEPTASLDAEAEAAIFGELRDGLADRVGIVISHRFSTVRVADRIAVIEGGRLIELGSHDELIACGGRYAELFDLQAVGYR